MTTYPNFMCGFLLLSIGVWKGHIVSVRSVCLEDVLTFYNSKISCAFRKDDYNNIFKENSKRCQINCSIESSDQAVASTMNDTFFEIKKMRIRFTSTSYEFPLKSKCSNGSIENFDIDLDCDGEYLLERSIGERCVSDNQCLNVTVNSTCNETTELCQCMAKHVYLWERNTCSPARGLGGQCYDSRQCKEVNQHSMCTSDNICKCQYEYIEKDGYCLIDKKREDSSLVFGFGIAGFVLGAVLCGFLCIIVMCYRKRSQTRCAKCKEEITEKRISQFSNPNAVTNEKRGDISKGKRVHTSNPSGVYNKNRDDNLEGNDVYNHLHEDPKEVCVQPDYDHVQPQVAADDDYSHMITRNANNMDIPGEYGVIS